MPLSDTKTDDEHKKENNHKMLLLLFSVIDISIRGVPFCEQFV